MFKFTTIKFTIKCHAQSEQTWIIFAFFACILTLLFACFLFAFFYSLCCWEINKERRIFFSSTFNAFCASSLLCAFCVENAEMRLSTNLTAMKIMTFHRFRHFRLDAVRSMVIHRCRSSRVFIIVYCILQFIFCRFLYSFFLAAILCFCYAFLNEHPSQISNRIQMDEEKRNRKFDSMSFLWQMK